MPVMIQLRDVPETMHRELKVRAAESGQSLSDFIKGEMKQVISRPTRAQLLERLRKLPSVEVSEDPTLVIRKARDGFDRP